MSCVGYTDADCIALTITCSTLRVESIKETEETTMKTVTAVDEI